MIGRPTIWRTLFTLAAAEAAGAIYCAFQLSRIAAMCAAITMAGASCVALVALLKITMEG